MKAPARFKTGLPILRATIGSLCLLIATALAGAPTAAAASSTTRTPDNPDYTVALTSDSAGRRWTGNESITFRNAATVTLDTIWLRLWSNGVDGCSRQAITVSQITGGTAGKLSVGCTALPVALDHPLAPGASASIAMSVSIALPSRNDRFGYWGGLAMVGTALPTLAIHDGAGWHLDRFVDLGESFYSVVGHYRVSLTVPRALSTPTTGALASSSDNGNGTETRTYSATNVRDFEWAAGALSSVQGTDAHGVRIRVSFRPARYSSSAAQGALANAIRDMNEFERDFGAFPYPELDIVLSPLAYHGMEYPTFVLSDTNQISISHELAHQWWYGIVGNDQFSSPWLDESFATWAEYLPLSPVHCSGPSAWPSSAARLTNSMAYWGRYPKQYWVVYSQGACALADAADHLGLANFKNVLQDYASAHWFDFSTTADFKAAINKAAAKYAPGWNVAAYWTKWRI